MTLAANVLDLRGCASALGDDAGHTERTGRCHRGKARRVDRYDCHEWVSTRKMRYALLRRRGLARGCHRWVYRYSLRMIGSMFNAARKDNSWLCSIEHR